MYFSANFCPQHFVSILLQIPFQTLSSVSPALSSGGNFSVTISREKDTIRCYLKINIINFTRTKPQGVSYIIKVLKLQQYLWYYVLFGSEAPIGICHWQTLGSPSKKITKT